MKRSAALLAYLLVAVSLSIAPPVRAAEPDAALRLRIGVTSDGIVRLTPSDLSAAGLDPALVDPRIFALSSLGTPVALRVTGEADGRFDPGDELIFFGQRFRGPEMDQKYTDERVYWLDSGGSPGPRMGERTAAPQPGDPTPADFLTTLHFEESREWWTLHTLYADTQDTWFWQRLAPIGAGKTVTATLSVETPSPAPGLPATLRLGLLARSSSGPVNPDHGTRATLGGVTVLEQAWDGRDSTVLTGAAPVSLLADGANALEVSTWVQPDLSLDDLYVNYVEVDYHRLFRAHQGRLDFRIEGTNAQSVRSDGWASAAVEIWDVSDPLHPVRVTGATAEDTGPGTALTFRHAGGAALYWLQDSSTPLAPASLRLRPPTGLRAPTGGADAVIVAPLEFRPAALRLAKWHAANGRRAVVADILDVYDEFNNGILHPKAITAMLAWGTTHWEGAPPRFLTLVGDGHWNFKGFNPAVYPPQPNPIPPLLAWIDPWQGEVPADPLLGDLDGDGVPEIAVGRLAANTAAEADLIVDKIVAYDQTLRTAPWQRRAVFVADNADDSGNFPVVSDEIVAGYTPADLLVQRVYVPAPPPGLPVPGEEVAAVRAALSRALRAGAFMVQYTGHGAPSLWAHEQILTGADIEELDNGVALPVVMTFACLDGYFAHPQPANFALAELMQRRAGGGSIASISSTGLGATGVQLRFRKLLLQALFNEGVSELGTAVLLAKQRYTAAYGPNYLNGTITLFGDPTLRVPVGLPRTYYPFAAVRP